MSSSGVSVPSESDLARESGLLPAGWVVGWSRSNMRRYYARPPGPHGPEIKQWEPPKHEHAPIAAATATVAAAAKPPGLAAAARPSTAAATPVRILPSAPLIVVPPPVVQPPQLHMPRSPRSPTSLPPPLFLKWQPPAEALIREEAAALDAAAASLAEHAAASSAHRKELEAEREREKDLVAAEAQTKKRRAGLGFGSEDSDDPPAQRQKLAHSAGPAAMRFVSAGGAEAATPASHAPTASDGRVFATLASDPRRLESASLPRCTVANPPVYTTSLEAFEALTAAGASTPLSTEWSDATKYHDILRSSVVIAVNSIYASKDASRMEDYLAHDKELPPPPVRDLAEEPPALINARRAVFNELDANLTQLVRAAGLRDQPTMAFLRWGFNQRSLQNPTFQAVDPLLPVDASIDACLAHELVRERVTREAAREVCRQLSERCKEKAEQLIDMKQQLMRASPTDEPSALVKQFDLLLPHESHLHSFAKSAAGPSADSGMLAQRERDLHTFNQSEREQYKLIYDWRGPNEYAIPLNHHRFTQLCEDYRRCTGPIEPDVKTDQLFLRRLWTMCARYDTISGAGYQAALPEESFFMLRKYWGVEHECYASPLNHCLDSFGSAFIDTDRFFGSKGQMYNTRALRADRLPTGNSCSFLDHRPLSGSFEANPPFTEEVMAPMAMHILALMERAQLAGSPLCFVVIWPGWDDTPAYDLLMTSRFMRKLIVFERNDHSYKEGLQHRVTKAVYRQSRARSFVFWVQTDAAADKWPCSDDRLAEFKQSFMARR